MSTHKLARLQALGFKKPPPLSVEAAGEDFSPAPLQSWHLARDLGEAMPTAFRSSRRKEGRGLLDLLYTHWANGSEGELEVVAGAQLPRKGCRGPGSSIGVEACPEA